MDSRAIARSMRMMPARRRKEFRRTGLSFQRSECGDYSARSRGSHTPCVCTSQRAGYFVKCSRNIKWIFRSRITSWPCDSRDSARNKRTITFIKIEAIFSRRGPRSGITIWFRCTRTTSNAASTRRISPCLSIVTFVARI